jgi:acetylornithine/N-succinyldiaminopimelate aminotransferase
MTVLRSAEQIMSTYRRWPIEIVSGRGCLLYDTDGKEYLDLVAGLAVASVGHAHPRLAEAIAEQSARLVHVSNLYATGPQQELAARLAGLTGGMQSFFCNSGAEAVEAAIKLARKHAEGRHGIIATEGGFHGRTMGALSATGQPGKKTAFEPLVPGFTHVPYDDVEALAAAIDDNTAAVLIEPIQGEAGVVVPAPGYLAEVREVCDRAGILLILDEVQTGIGRTGSWFAYEHSGVTPDIMCLAKGLAAGLPIGACLATPAVAASFVPGDHATTFGGGPVQCAAAIAVLDVIDDEGLLANAASVGEFIKERVGGLPGVSEVRGRGLLIGIRLTDDKAHEVAALALERGVLVNDPTPDIVRICPPLVITEEQAATGADVVAGAIAEVMS